MTEDEQVNCTFQPNAGQNLSRKQKKIFKAANYEWSDQYLRRDPNKGIDRRVKEMGVNSIKTNPIIYQQGTFKRALILW